jgi:parallel beta-helix repeat protein
MSGTWWRRSDRIHALQTAVRRIHLRSRPWLEVLEDRLSPATITVTNTGDSAAPGSGSLRAAILAANSHPGSTIDFKISGSGAHVIQPASALPAIMAPVVINGYSEAGAVANMLTTGDNAVLKIVLDGSLAGSQADGLLVKAGQTTIEGMNIRDFGGNAIHFEGAASGVVAGDFIGTNVTGTAAMPNQNGVEIDTGSASNHIGGSVPAARDVISGNKGLGVRMIGSGVTGNLVQGDYIGPSASGTQSLAVPGSSWGVEIMDTQNNTIGGTSSADRNIISGGSRDGVGIDGIHHSNNLVASNWIGLGATGSALGNALAGVFLDSGSHETISGNIIAGNHGSGILLLDGSALNQIRGNDIGTNALRASGLGNKVDGIDVETPNNIIGGTMAGAGNTIAFNSGIGVAVIGSASIGNAIRGNSIFGNAHLGIDLGADGVTLNNSHGHMGPNGFQNFPILNQAASSGLVTSVSGTLGGSLPRQSYFIDFYASPQSDPSGYGQGKRYIGSLTVLTDGSGKASFSTTLSVGGLAGQFISATATAANGDTSEFCKDVIAKPAPTYTSGVANPLPAGSLLTSQVGGVSPGEAISLPQMPGASDPATSPSTERAPKNASPVPARVSIEQPPRPEAVPVDTSDQMQGVHSVDAFFQRWSDPTPDLLSLDL